MASYNSFIFTGHGISEVDGSYDPGASAQGAKENDLAKLITSAAKQELQTNPQTKNLSIHYDEQNYIDNDTSGNTYTSKSGISVHINAAGGASGTEIWVPCKETYLETDFALVANVSGVLGIPNRGVKSRDYDSEGSFKRTNGVALGYKDYYKEIRQAWENGLSLSILEVGFIDSGDLGKMQSKVKEIGFEVAKYIAKANDIDLKKYVAPSAPSAPATQPGKYYRICVGSFGNKDNAVKALEEVRSKGYPSAFIHEC